MFYEGGGRVGGWGGEKQGWGGGQEGGHFNNFTSPH